MRNLFRLLKFLGLTIIVGSVLANAWVIYTTRDRVYQKSEELPNTDVVLVLGTSKRTVDGGANPYFQNRMEAAINLYKEGKVKLFLLSGHNPSRYYNEPRDMKVVLVEAGVPESAIQVDTAGSRTYESMLRFREAYPERSVTIVTQEFHVYRALYISNHLGIDAVAFTAHNTSISRSFDVLVREYFARIKAVGEVVLRPSTEKIVNLESTD